MQLPDTEKIYNIELYPLKLGDLLALNLQTNLSKVEMVLYQVMGKSSENTTLEYIQWQSQKFNAGSTSLMETFNLKPECMQVILMQNNTANLRSDRSHLDHYRLILDGEDCTNRDIVVRNRASRPLHNDRMYISFQNMNLQLKHLDGETLIPTSFNNRPLTLGAQDTLILCQPTPLTPAYKQLDVNLYSDGLNLLNVGILYMGNRQELKL